MGTTPSKPANSTVEPETSEKLAQSFAGLEVTASTSPVSANGSLSSQNIESWERAVSSSKTKLSRSILVHSDISSALLSRPALISNSHLFNVELDTKTSPITNQKSSGRCWLFASTNVMRYEITRKLKLDDFQLSQSYLFFYDKLNKANYYLENMIELADQPIDDRVVSFLSSDLISDGGQWDMVVNLVENYGLVPQTVFPESTHSSLSSPINSLLKTKLREHALILRRAYASMQTQGLSKGTVIAALRVKKEELMKDVYNIMTATLGVPPGPNDKFVWEYQSQGKVGRWEGTPLQFYKTFVSPQADSFSLINDPRNAYSTLFTVDRLGNVFGGRPVLYVNTEVENMKSVVVKMVKAGVPVFFGCDVGEQILLSCRRCHGPYCLQLRGCSTFDITLGLTKAERLQINESAMTHAMVISGVHLDSNGSPVRFKVENSWGPDVGDKGYFVMSSAWFDEFVYQVVVPRGYAPKDLLRVYDNGNPVVLPPYDPMGALA
ncbi:Cysteine proteinase 1, mitochondrial [Mycena indigotica]|uniref:Cysteine proteinase 1, mitochondrial n=1 Tax=Mycena indigotica TaxID=2126181 RepID=A0A8H6SLV2_9AGAR|nr:Cysteine proteinase 1, mitochondrial [Mycena indigotica]KAF7301207.1 Cysteine proteinase 1, mitochondrial [Mycena indigotica]